MPGCENKSKRRFATKMLQPGTEGLIKIFQAYLQEVSI